MSVIDRLKVIRGARQDIMDGSKTFRARVSSARVGRKDSIMSSLATQSVTALHEDAELLGAGFYRIIKRFPFTGCFRQNFSHLMPYWPQTAKSVDQCVFIDTETNGLGTASGTLAFMIGLLWIENNECRMEQLFITDFAAENAMLEYMLARFHTDTVFVSYNGKQFDLPLLQSRLRLVKMKHSLDQYAHIDLLYSVRLAFQRRWSDCRLQTAEKKLLEVFRVDDFPGDQAPDAWFSLLRTGCAGKFNKLLEHNQHDLFNLAKLLLKLHDVYSEPDVFNADVVRIARRRIKEGALESACKVLVYNDNSESLGLLAMLLKQQGAWIGAVRIWKRLAADGCGVAMLELAKFYEHKQKNYSAAFNLTRHLYRLEPGPVVLKRLERIQRRLESSRLQKDTNNT